MRTGGKTRAPAAFRGDSGQGSKTERIPFAVWGVSSSLPKLAKEAQSDIIAAKSAAHRRPDDPAAKLPYGMRRNRAICPDCGTENGPGKYDPATGRCGKECTP